MSHTSCTNSILITCLTPIVPMFSTQCAECWKEAVYYCCWNTSYCSYQCQQKHWPYHMPKCVQNQAQSMSSSSTSSSSQVSWLHLEANTTEVFCSSEAVPHFRMVQPFYHPWQFRVHPGHDFWLSFSCWASPLIPAFERGYENSEFFRFQQKVSTCCLLIKQASTGTLCSTFVKIWRVTYLVTSFVWQLSPNGFMLFFFNQFY